MRSEIAETSDSLRREPDNVLLKISYYDYLFSLCRLRAEKKT